MVEESEINQGISEKQNQLGISEINEGIRY
jgi:hypothetical protein